MNKQELAKIPREQRLRIYNRDSFECKACKSLENLTLDHILPVSEGGTNDDTNLQTLCLKCNNKKANLLILSFFGRIKKLLRLVDDYQAWKNVINGSVWALKYELKSNLDSLKGVYVYQKDWKSHMGEYNAKVKIIENLTGTVMMLNQEIQELRSTQGELKKDIEELKSKKKTKKTP